MTTWRSWRSRAMPADRSARESDCYRGRRGPSARRRNTRLGHRQTFRCNDRLGNFRPTVSAFHQYQPFRGDRHADGASGSRARCTRLASHREPIVGQRPYLKLALAGVRQWLDDTPTPDGMSTIDLDQQLTERGITPPGHRRGGRTSGDRHLYSAAALPHRADEQPARSRPPATGVRRSLPSARARRFDHERC